MGDETNTPIFAGVFSKSSAPFITNHNMDSKTFMDTCEWAKKNSYILTWAAIYGGFNRLYAGIWDKFPSGNKWDYGIYTALEGPEVGVPVQMQNNPSLQLSFVTRSPAAEYLAVYRNKYRDIKERHGLTISQFLDEKNSQELEDYYPFCVQAGGDPRFGDVPRFVAIFDK
jgi:hypothetical protein